MQSLILSMLTPDLLSTNDVSKLTTFLSLTWIQTAMTPQTRMLTPAMTMILSAMEVALARGEVQARVKARE